MICAGHDSLRVVRSKLLDHAMSSQSIVVFIKTMRQLSQVDSVELAQKFR